MPEYLFLSCTVPVRLRSLPLYRDYIYCLAYLFTALVRVDWCSFTALLVALLVDLRSYSGVWYSPYLFLFYLYIYYLLNVAYCFLV